MIITLKLKVSIVGSSEDAKSKRLIIYKEQYEQYKALNLCISMLHTHNILGSYNSTAENKLNNKIKLLTNKVDKCKQELKSTRIKAKKVAELNNKIETYSNDIIDLEYEHGKSKLYRSDIDIKFKELYINNLYNVIQNQVNFQHKDLASLAIQKAKKDYCAALKNGLARGDISLIQYKRNAPLMSRGSRWLNFRYGDDNNIYIDWIHNITFKVIKSVKNNSRLEYVNNILEKIILKEYKVCESTISHYKKNLFILNLNIDIPDVYDDTDYYDRKLGVVIGHTHPILTCSSHDLNKNQYIGSKDDIENFKFKLKRKLLVSNNQLPLINGGHGYKKKFKSINRLKEKDNNFIKTYNHMLSKNIIDTAKKYKCKYLIVEKIEYKDIEHKVLGRWKYYDFYNMLEYKANKSNLLIEYRPTSSISAQCTRCIYENELSYDVDYKCNNCKTSIDYNLVINILS